MLSNFPAVEQELRELGWSANGNRKLMLLFCACLCYHGGDADDSAVWELTELME